MLKVFACQDEAGRVAFALSGYWYRTTTTRSRNYGLRKHYSEIKFAQIQRSTVEIKVFPVLTKGGE
jgi:hypothetical protein